MSLGVFQNSNSADYMRGGKFAATVASEMTWIFTSTNGTRNSTVWLDRLGLWQTGYASNAGVRNGIIRTDPLLVDNSSDAIKRIDPYGLYLHVGAFVPQSGFQRMFGVDGISSARPWQLVDYNDPTNILDTNVFPNVTQLEPSGASGITSIDVGYFDTNDNSEWLFFESWDHDGSGNTVGTALVLMTDVRDASGLITECAGLVNLDTGAAVPILGLPTLYKSVPDNEYQSGELFGETRVEFDSVQWLPDDDSTATAPKGQIFLSGQFSATGRHYGKWVEFNPTAVNGTPVRTHLRERLITRFEVALQQSVATFPGSTSNSICSTSNGVNRLKINRQTGRPTMLTGVEGGTISEFNTDVYNQATIEATSQAVTSEQTKPVPRQQVTTNRIVIFGSESVGDLGERVAGQSVDWTLERISTQKELLATTPTPGETVTVANDPIDRNANFPFDVYEDGIALTETTHYTVNEALGQITFVAPKPLAGGEVYEVDYAHPTVPVTPAFGTLLVNQSASDENGEAFTRVKYADTDLLEGFVDELSVDST